MRGLARALAAALALIVLAGFTAAEVSAVDALLQSVAERLALAVPVAKAKWNSGAEIDDPEREAELLASVPPGLPRDFVRAQIDASKDVQRVLIRSWQGQGRFPDEDLAGKLRPQLTAITQRMVVQVQAVEPLLKQDGFAGLLSDRSKVVLKDVPWEVRDRALAPLLQHQLQNVEGHRGGGQGRGLARGIVGWGQFDNVCPDHVQVLQGL